VFSDIHVGSRYSVCSEKPEIDGAADYKPSQNQKKLLTGWYNCVDKITQKPRAVVINGEPIDGDNKKSLADSVWSSNIDDQINDFKRLFSPIKTDNLIFVRGSGYHVTKDATNFEKTIAREMNARKYRSIMGDMTMVDYEATVRLLKKHIHFTHHIGYSGWWMYRPTPVARELIKMHFAHRENGFHTDVVVRSHVHYYVEVRFPHTIGLTTPAWKFPDGFMYRRGEPELPSIGCVEIIVEPNGRIDVYPHLIDVEFKKPVIEL